MVDTIMQPDSDYRTGVWAPRTLAVNILSIIQKAQLKRDNVKKAQLLQLKTYRGVPYQTTNVGKGMKGTKLHYRGLDYTCRWLKKPQPAPPGAFFIASGRLYCPLHELCSRKDGLWNFESGLRNRFFLLLQW